MPKDKKRAIKESDSDSDSGPDDKGPAKKAAKTSGGSSSCTMGADGEPSWSLGNMKFVKVIQNLFITLMTLIKCLFRCVSSRARRTLTYVSITWTNKQWTPSPARKAFLSIANSIRNSSQSYPKSTRNCPSVLTFIQYPSQRVPPNNLQQLDM